MLDKQLAFRMSKKTIQSGIANMTTTHDDLAQVNQYKCMILYNIQWSKNDITSSTPSDALPL